MEILYFSKLKSTQLYLIERLRLGELQPPIAIVADNQIGGVGSRNNSWEGGEGNLFLSFALNITSLPSDLPIHSASIYFALIMKITLNQFEDEVWVKWSNDLYYGDNKIGGVVTKQIGESIICGIGVNLKANSNQFQALKIPVERSRLISEYFQRLERFPSWESLFLNYKREFSKNFKFYAHIDGEYVSLKGASLQSDGSIVLNGKKIFSLR